VAFFQSLSSYKLDTSVLSKRFDERAGFVSTDAQNTEAMIGRIKSESPRPSKEYWSEGSSMDARQGCSEIKLDQ
jgi:hypothetical protein